MEDLIRGGMDLARPILDRAIHEKFEAEQIIGKPRGAVHFSNIRGSR
jgi:hypothetical protein